MRTKKENELEERISLLEEHVLKQGKLIGDITDALLNLTQALKQIHEITSLHKN